MRLQKVLDWSYALVVQEAIPCLFAFSTRATRAIQVGILGGKFVAALAMRLDTLLFCMCGNGFLLGLVVVVELFARHGFFKQETFLESGFYGSHRNAAGLLKFGDVNRTDHTTSTRVPSLLGARCPAAVAGFVVAVNIYAIKRSSVRALPHVFTKMLKRVYPALTNSYTSAAVVFEMIASSVKTPRLHVVPSAVKNLVHGGFHSQA
jgi:hypothetical protein